MTPGCALTVSRPANLDMDRANGPIEGLGPRAQVQPQADNLERANGYSFSKESHCHCLLIHRQINRNEGKGLKAEPGRISITEWANGSRISAAGVVPPNE